MDIKRCGSPPSGKAPAEYFTGTVGIDPLFQANVPARAVGVSVTFESGAGTAWHTHPPGQTLIVTAGCGRAQRWGGPIEEIRPGGVIWFYVRSWRGRTAAWFRGTKVRQEGRIRAGGVDKDVTFIEEWDAHINDQIDAAYRTKYSRHSAQYVDPMVGPEARLATIRLVPRA